MSRRRVAIHHEGKPLAFRIFKRQRRCAIDGSHFAMRNLQLRQPSCPIVQRRLRRHPEPGARDRPRAPPLAGHRPIKERDVRPRRRQPIGVEQVVSRGVILVDGLFDQPQAQDLRIKMVIRRGIGGNSGEMVETGKKHGSPSCVRKNEMLRARQRRGNN
jgi:hypothetical protein